MVLSFQAKSALALSLLAVTTITPACAHSRQMQMPHAEGRGHTATARTNQYFEDKTTVFFVLALSVMAVLFVVLALDSLTGSNFVNRGNTYRTSTKYLLHAKRWAPGLVAFVPAVAYHFCRPCLQHSRNLESTF